MKKSNHIKTISTGAITLICCVLVINLLLAVIFPDWKGFISNDTLAGFNAVFSKTQSLDKPESKLLSLAQGGVNILKPREVVEDIINEAEENAPIGTTAPKPESPAPATDDSTSAADSTEGNAPKIEMTDQQKIEYALKTFQEALVDRDVIKEGQEDFLHPYISKSFRDNPFDEVQEVDPIYAIPTEGLPPDPFYPPPGTSGGEDPQKTLKDYVKTIDLQGVIQIEDKYFAFIDTGAQTRKQSKGDSYKDKININVDDISLDAVLLSDEFGNKAYIDFGFRKGFEVQPVDDVIYITNLGVKQDKEE